MNTQTYIYIYIYIYILIALCIHPSPYFPLLLKSAQVPKSPVFLSTQTPCHIKATNVSAEEFAAIENSNKSACWDLAARASAGESAGPRSSTAAGSQDVHICPPRRTIGFAPGTPGFAPPMLPSTAAVPQALKP